MTIGKPYFKWTQKAEKAALLVFQDDLLDEDIAKECGVVRSTLSKWKALPEFQARVEEIAEAARKSFRKKSLASKEARVSVLDDIHSRLLKVVEERAKQHENIDDLDASPAAGASSGLMVLTVKHLPGGGRVEEWAVDTGTVDSVLKVQKQAAQELGDWTEKKEHSGPGGGPLSVVITEMIVEMPGDE